MKYLSAIVLGIAFLVVGTSCNKDDESLSTQDQDTEQSAVIENEMSAEYLMNYTETLEDEAIEFRTIDTPCVTVSWAAPKGSFPNTVTIDFGDGCIGPHGHLRKGKIIVDQSAPISEAGAVRETTFEHYSVDSIGISGLKKQTNNGLNSEGKPSFTSLVDIELEFPNGDLMSRYSEITKTKIRGGHTQISGDDVFALSGTASGVLRNGLEYQANITNPLIKTRICRWLIDGTVQLIRDGREVSIDYGFKGSTCDRLALITFEDGSTKIIKIHKIRW